MSTLWFWLHTAIDVIKWGFVGLVLESALLGTNCQISPESRAIGQIECLQRSIDPGWGEPCGPGSVTGRDPWDRPLRFSMREDVSEVRSAGDDGRFDTRDDVVGYYGPSTLRRWVIDGREIVVGSG